MLSIGIRVARWLVKFNPADALTLSNLQDAIDLINTIIGG